MKYLVSSYSSVVALQQRELFVKSPEWFFCSKQDSLEVSMRGQTWTMVQQKTGSGSCTNWVFCVSLWLFLISEVVFNTLSLNMLIQLNEGIKFLYSIYTTCTFTQGNERDSSKNSYPCDAKPKVLNTDDKSNSRHLTWLLVLWFENSHGNFSLLFYHLNTVWSVEHWAALCLLW